MVAPSRLTFPELPAEMRENILRFLDVKSLLAACGVSKAWLRVISPVWTIWNTASRTLGILIANSIRLRMCRQVFLRLAQRWRSFLKHCSFVTKEFPLDDVVTAIGYHDERLVTGFWNGKVAMWNCANYQRIWESDSIMSEVTYIKLDYRIVISSHANGVVMSRKANDGSFVRHYSSPCAFTRTVDYLSEANLVFSADKWMVAWNMTSGKLVLAENHGDTAKGLLVAPYPGEERSIGTDVQKLLVASRTLNVVMLWEAISKVDAEGEMNVSANLFNVIWVGCPRILPCMASLGDQFHFDGHFLYFSKHGDDCNSVVSQWDVPHGHLSADVTFRNPIMKLVGVGKKYMLAMVLTGTAYEMSIVEKTSGRYLTRVQVCSVQLDVDNGLHQKFCIGERAWLDGFDGNNDVGAILFYIAHRCFVKALGWRDRNVERYRSRGRGNYRGRRRRR